MGRATPGRRSLFCARNRPGSATLAPLLGTITPMALRKGKRAMRAAAALALATLILPGVLLRKSVVEEWQILNLRYGGEIKKWRAARKLGEVRYRRAVPVLIA